jgi:hypothetical protein
VKLVPLLSPSIDLSAFRHVVPQSIVNQVDGRPLPPVAKFAALVDESLSQPAWAYWHLYEAFYFELPVQVIVELDGFQHARCFRLTTQGAGLMAEGLISGPYDLWREFLAWAANGSEYMQMFARALYGYFRRHDFFKTLTDNVPALR